MRRIVSSALIIEANDDALREITLTAVRISRDLGVADLYWVFLTEEMNTPNRRAILDRTLARATGFLRRVLARELKIKHVPELRFHFDESQTRARRIEELLATLPPPAEDNEPQPDEAAPEDDSSD